MEIVMNTRWIARSALASCVALFLVATAQRVHAEGKYYEMAQQAFGEFSQRLKLSPDQEAQVKPLFEARNSKLKEIHDKYASDTSRRAKRSAMQEAKNAQDDFNSKLKPILSPEQQAELDKMRKEARDKMKEEWQARKAAQ
jgi:Spy/CpxP family protein refolding chaperone